MPKVFLFVTLFLASAIGYCQVQPITISGTVTDAETGEFLVYATVGLIGIPVGTISNAKGEFDFHIPEHYAAETVQISMILVMRKGIH